MWKSSAAVVAVLGAVGWGAAGTAVASPVSPAGPVATEEAAPSCFSLRQWEDFTVTGFRSHAEVKNNCTWAYRVRIIWKNDFDGSCKNILPGTGFSEWRQGKMPSVDEIRLC